jgi:hypothetical protein
VPRDGDLVNGPLLAGVDISTFAVTAALIPLDPGTYAPAILRTIRIDPAPIAERLRNVRGSVHAALADADGCEIASVWVEQPPPPTKFAMKGHDSLVAVFGSVCGNVPKRITAVAQLMPSEWREVVALSLAPKAYPSEKPTDRWKRAAIERVMGSDLVAQDYPLSHHEAEAVLVALAGRHLTWRHHNNELKERHAHH